MAGEGRFRDGASEARGRVVALATAAAVVAAAVAATLLGWHLGLPFLGLSAVAGLSVSLLYGAGRLGRAEMARLRAERRFRAIFRSGMIGVAVWDAAGGIRDANDAFLALTGCGREDLQAGRLDWRDLFPSRASNPAGRVDDANPQEDVCVRRDGTRVPLQIGSAPLVGEPGLSLSIVLAPTRQRSIEEQPCRDDELQSLGRVTGAAAHDLNNLLMVIMGNAEMLAVKLAGDPRLLEMAELVGKAARRGAALSGRLLAVARRQPPEPAAVDVNCLLADMEGRLRNLLGRDIRAELILDAASLPAMTDAAALEAAILNLALDARDAMPAGGHLTLRTAEVRVEGTDSGRSAQLRPGRYVAISITASAGAAAEEGGSGLGLARGLLKQSGGQVSLDSSARDMAATIYLPRAPDAAAPPATLAPPDRST